MATASLLPLPRAVFFDANGDPLAAGFVYTYIPGGTVPKLTWQDSGETTPNSNPIVLDAAGSALIYGTGVYQITVTDSLGNQIPAYSGLTSDILSAFTSASGATLINYQPPAAGGVIRTVSAKLTDVLTLFDFGADPTGATDSTASIQAAFTWAATTGGTLGSSPGLFKVSAPLTLLPGLVDDPVYFRPGPEINLGQRCYIQATASMDQMLTIGSNASDYSGLINFWRLWLGTWDCNRLANVGIVVSFAYSCHVRDTRVRNWLTYGFQGGTLGSPAASSEIYFEDCRTDRTLVSASISGITRANPGVVTTAAPHGIVTGGPIFIEGVAGMTQINGTYFTATVLSPTTFALATSNPSSAGVDTTGYSPYVSGGLVWLCNPTGSVSIFYDNATDFAITNCVLLGGEIGVSANSTGGLAQGNYDGKILNTHIWNYPQSGEFLYGFDMWGDTHIIGCQVDAPFQYAFHFHAASNSIISSEVNYGGNGSFSNHAYPILLEAGAGVSAINCDWKDTNSNTPLVAEATGDLALYNSAFNFTTNTARFGSRSPITVNTWAYIQAGATPAILEGQNVGAVLRNGVGDYGLTTNNTLSGNFAISVTASTTSGTPLVGNDFVAGRAPNTMRIVFHDLAGVLTDPATFSVMVVQLLPTTY